MIYVLGHGGNLAVADHAAVDMTRLNLTAPKTQFVQVLVLLRRLILMTVVLNNGW